MCEVWQSVVSIVYIKYEMDMRFSGKQVFYGDIHEKVYIYIFLGLQELYKVTFFIFLSLFFNG